LNEILWPKGYPDSGQLIFAFRKQVGDFSLMFSAFFCLLHSLQPNPVDPQAQEHRAFEKEGLFNTSG